MPAFIFILVFSRASLSNAVDSDEPEIEIPDDRLRVSLTPYIWMTSLSGDSQIGSNMADLDLSFGDIVKNLQLGAMIDLRIEKQRWAIQSDLVWADLNAEDTVIGVNFELSPEMFFLELDARYRVDQRLEFFLGTRLYSVENEIKVNGLTVSRKSGEWVDPYVGVHYKHPLTNRWDFGVRGDIGGFGIGSKFSYQLWLMFEYHVRDYFDIGPGYRHLGFDYATGSGAGRFELDAYLTGPLFALGFNF